MKIINILDLCVFSVLDLIIRYLKYKIEDSLRVLFFKNLRLIHNIKCYKSFRHIYNLSVNGQRTKTNCRTQKNKNSNV